jgi:O-antigen/teichoic acid export membrane protein
MRAKRTFAVDFTGMLATTMFTAFLSMAVSILIARLLGPEGKGVLTIINLLVGQIGLVLTLGVEVALIHYGGHRQWSLDELASASMGLSILLGIGGFLLAGVIFAFVFQKVIPGELSPLLVVITFTIPMALTVRFLRSLIRVSGRIIEDGFLSVSSAFLRLLAISSVFIMGSGLQAILVGVCFESLVSTLLTLALALRWSLIRKRPVYAPFIWKPLVTYGLKSHVGSVLQALNYRFDMYLVTFLLGTVSVGLYSVAVAMAEWLWLLSSVLSPVFMQRVAIRSEQQANAMMGPLNRLTSATLIICIPSWGLLGGWLMRWLYGEVFDPAYYPFLLLLPGTWALGMWKNIMNDLAVRGYPAYKSYTSGVAVILTILLDIALIPGWGIAGAAVASSIAYYAAFGVGLLWYCRITHYYPWDILVPRSEDLILVFEKFRGSLFTTVRNTA